MAVTYIWPEAETIGPESENWLQELKNLGTCIVNTVKESKSADPYLFNHQIRHGKS
jgi:hypothetical protein